MSSDKFEQKLKERFADVQITPRPEVWQNIEQQLASQPSRRGGFFWLFGEGLLALAILFLFYSGGKGDARLPVLPPAGENVTAEQITTRNDLSLVKEPDQSPAPARESSGHVSTKANETRIAVKNPDPSLPLDKTTLSVKGPESVITQANPTAADNENPVSLTNERLAANSASSGQIGSEVHPNILPAGTPVERKLNAEKVQTTESIPEEKQGKPTLFIWNGSPVENRSYLLEERIDENNPDKLPVARLKTRRWAFWAQVTAENAFGINSLIPERSLNAAPNTSFDYSMVENSFQASPSNAAPDQVIGVNFPRSYGHVAAGAEYMLSRRFSLQAGLAYSVSSYGRYQRGTLNSTTSDLLSSGVNGNLVISLASFDFEPNEQFRTTQIEVPLYLNYYLRRKRSSFIFSLGGAGNYVLSRKEGLSPTNLEDARNTFGRNIVSNALIPDEDLLLSRKYHFYLGGNILWQYHLRSNMTFYTGPQYKYQITDIYAGDAASQQLRHRLGWQFGVKFFPGR